MNPVKQLFWRTITRTFGNDAGRVVVPCLSGPARGLRFELDLLRRAEPEYLSGRYDLPILRRLESECRPGMTVWDCGVYLGFYTAFFARAVGKAGSVVGVEPDPRNLARARGNLERNRLGNVHWVHAAVGDPRGEVRFVLQDDTNSHLPGSWIGSSRAEYERHAQGMEKGELSVRCLSLDELYFSVRCPKPDLVKLDIEGAEEVALQHASRLVAQVRPRWVIELHNPASDAAAWKFATEAGYQITSLTTGRPVETRDAMGGTVLLC